MGADRQDPPCGASDTNQELVIRLALGVLAGKGWIEEPDDDLAAALRRLYEQNPICQQQVRFTGELLHDMLAARPGEYLAAAWEQEQQDHWERHHAERWSCPCGETFGTYPFSDRRVLFYTLVADGLFAEHATDCPSCGRDLATTREEVPAGQLGFAL
jgi:ribosomal protein S27AE